jgi:serine/threonine protein phosphatase 1
MREFVMGDLHGSCRALKQCLKAASFNYQKDRLIQLGDVVDCNPEVFECVEELMKICHLIVVRGNHDDWFDEFCLTGRHPTSWIYGGIATARSYWNHSHKRSRITLDDNQLARELSPDHIPGTHRAFFGKLPLYHVDQRNRCFVHAGFNRFFPFTGQHPSTYYWDRDLWAEAVGWQYNERVHPQQAPFQIKTAFKEIYIGHSPTTCWNSTIPMHCANITNLDTGAGQGGKLTIMDLKTKKYWQSEPVARSPFQKPGASDRPCQMHTYI